MIRYQRTIRNGFACEGIGLHSGEPVRMLVTPAPANTGIVFIRLDLGGLEIPAIASNMEATCYATTVSRNGARIQTIEHLLSAFGGLHVDNAFVHLDGPEVPIMDGSAGPFVRLISDAGIEAQEQVQPFLKIMKPVFVRDGDKQVALWPAEYPSVSFFIDFDHPMLGQQCFHSIATEEFYRREVAPARTFGFLSDLKTLQAKGLARGASLDNAVALGEDSVINRKGLRYRDEFVRHKILDLIGDLALVGMPVIGHVVAHKTGHTLNGRMVNKILNSPQSWIIVGSAADAKPEQPGIQYQHALL